MLDRVLSPASKIKLPASTWTPSSSKQLPTTPRPDGASASLSPSPSLSPRLTRQPRAQPRLTCWLPRTRRAQLEPAIARSLLSTMEEVATTRRPAMVQARQQEAEGAVATSGSGEGRPAAAPQRRTRTPPRTDGVLVRGWVDP